MSMYEELDPKIWEKKGNELGNQEAIQTLFKDLDQITILQKLMMLMKKIIIPRCQF